MSSLANTTAPAPGVSGARPRRRADGTAIAAAIYAALLAIFLLRHPGPLSVTLLEDLFNNALPLAIAAGGCTLVVLTRGFDLSVAGVVSLSNVLLVTAIGDGPWAPLTGLALVLAVGAAAGAVNGFLVAGLGLQSVAATLCTTIVCSGLALLVLDFPGGYVPPFMAETLMGSVAGVVPVAAVIAALVAIAWMVLRRTDLGVAMYAIGADEHSAALAGVPVRRVRLIAYCLAGSMYGLAGYMLTALTATGDPNAGNAYLILAYAAVAIGGTSFAGGRGSVIGSMIGAATLTLLQKVLFSLGVLSFFTGIAEGLVLILAVVILALGERAARGARA